MPWGSFCIKTKTRILFIPHIHPNMFNSHYVGEYSLNMFPCLCLYIVFINFRVNELLNLDSSQYLWCQFLSKTLSFSLPYRRYLGDQKVGNFELFIIYRSSSKTRPRYEENWHLRKKKIITMKSKLLIFKILPTYRILPIFYILK